MKYWVIGNEPLPDWVEDIRGKIVLNRCEREPDILVAITRANGEMFYYGFLSLKNDKYDVSRIKSHKAYKSDKYRPWSYVMSVHNHRHEYESWCKDQFLEALDRKYGEEGGYWILGESELPDEVEDIRENFRQLYNAKDQFAVEEPDIFIVARNNGEDEYDNDEFIYYGMYKCRN